MSAQRVVNAVVVSTQKYLQLLINQNGGRSQYNAAQVQPQGEIFFEDARWIAYQCKLNRFLSIRSDSSATFIPDSQPGTSIEIYLIDYNRKNGETRFAAKTGLPNGNGRIVIDFRWLVKRCLDWYRSKGSSVAEVESVAKTGTGQSDYEQAEGQSTDQFHAVQTIMTEGMSYVWGPPGTGKTTWVLAKAAAHCVREEEKILILASTNLAVDNALAAVLKEGVCKSDVLRVGIPSEMFSKSYPECCEDRVFAAKIREIEREKKDLERAQTSLQLRQECERDIGENGKRQGFVDAAIAKLEREKDQISEQKSDSEAVLNRCEQDRKSCYDSLMARTKELDGLAFDNLVKEVQALECDHVQSVKRLADLEAHQKGLGLWASITGKKRKLKEAVAGEHRHMDAVEGTLASMRHQKKELEPRFTELKHECASLNIHLASVTKLLVQAQRANSKLMEKLRETVENLDNQRRERRAISFRIEQLRDHLDAADDFGPVENWEQERASWERRILELQAELDRFRQDFESKTVLGMTLDSFIGLTMQRCLDVDRVFIDEAPYAPLAKVIPVLGLHKPIAMLGDHCQLPPVYQGDNSDVAEAYWGRPAIFIEDAFQLGENFRTLCSLDEPSHRLIKRVILRESYRFGPDLAKLLDEYVYKGIGLKGSGKYNTSIESVHCEPIERNGRDWRENDSEVDEVLKRVKAWWEWAENKDSTLAILTPYKKQQYLINKKLRRRYRHEAGILDRVEIWSVHQSQGREWDTVFFSASDTGRLAGNSPWFSDSRRLVGRAILNTAISRAKEHLRIFNDRAWWGQQNPNSILTELANETGQGWNMAED